MRKRIGKGLLSTGFRVYQGHKKDGVSLQTLVSWSQRRCQRCHRFLSKKQFKFCAKCKPLNDKEVTAKIDREKYANDTEYRDLKKLKDKVYYNSDRFEIGQIV